MTELGGQNEGYKSKMCVRVVRPEWGVAPDWGRRSEMIGSRVWEIEGIRDQKVK